jgi:hypothetical protein
MRLFRHPAGGCRSRLLKCVLDARRQLLVAPYMEQEISVTDKVASALSYLSFAIFAVFRERSTRICRFPAVHRPPNQQKAQASELPGLRRVPQQRDIGSPVYQEFTGTYRHDFAGTPIR